MIQGTVVGLQILIGVVFRLPNRPDLQIEFVVDTGFEGALTLPQNVVAALGLPALGQINANLADDSSAKVDVYQATILWHGQEVPVALLAMGKRPLLGTSLLDGFNLNADFEDQGVATLQRL
jgi:clan AA aspartic protease